MTTVTRPRVGWGDLLWVAWRRHRALILATAALVALTALLVAWLGYRLRTAANWMSYPSLLLVDQLFSADIFFGLLIGLFWGAPLVAREYELRTNLVAWGQDVRGSRWLVGQIALLAVVAAVLGAVVGLVTDVLLDANRPFPASGYRSFRSESFEAVPHAQIAYALFAFALGVAASTVVRRTIPAMAVTAVGFLGTREVLARWGREHYLPPLHSFQEWRPAGVTSGFQVPENALHVVSGYADANGVRMDYPQECIGVNVDVTPCVRSHGLAGHYAEFQPIERLDLFRWIETGIFLVLAAGLLVLAWYWVGRARRV